MRLVVPLAVLVVALPGCGDRATYSRQEVVDAFRLHGYVLVTVPKLPRGLLAPHGGPPFLVAVASADEVDDAWYDYESQQTPQTFDLVGPTSS